MIEEIGLQTVPKISQSGTIPGKMAHLVILILTRILTFMLVCDIQRCCYE